MLHTLFKAESSSDSLVFSNSTYQRLSAFFFPQALSTADLIWTKMNWNVSPEGLCIALASRDQLREQVRIIDFRNGTERNLQLQHGWSIFSLSWTADGNALVAAAMLTRHFIARIVLDGQNPRAPNPK